MFCPTKWKLLRDTRYGASRRSPELRHDDQVRVGLLQKKARTPPILCPFPSRGLNRSKPWCVILEDDDERRQRGGGAKAEEQVIRVAAIDLELHENPLDALGRSIPSLEIRRPYSFPVLAQFRGLGFGAAHRRSWRRGAGWRAGAATETSEIAMATLATPGQPSGHRLLVTGSACVGPGAGDTKSLAKSHLRDRRAVTLSSWPQRLPPTGPRRSATCRYPRDSSRRCVPRSTRPARILTGYAPGESTGTERLQGGRLYFRAREGP